jgi:multidrug resistance efflux pump
MRDHAGLSECRDFALTLRARPPLLAHGALWLSAGLLLSAAGWAAWAQADVVARAPGRMRPVAATVKVFSSPRAESSGLSGRVAEVCARPGDVVKAGQVLLRRDTERLDNEIARKRRALQAAEEELARLEVMRKLQARQAAAAKLRGEAEVAQAEQELAQAAQRREADVKLAESEAEAAEDELRRARRLIASRAATEEEVGKARAAAGVARARLEKARLPADDGKARVARQALAVVEREAEVKAEELAARQLLKRAEADSARLEVANLDLERRECEVRSPIDGVVTSGEPKPGDALEPGKPVMEVAAAGRLMFEAVLPSGEMAGVEVGMAARVRLDAYDWQRYGVLTGRVCFVAPDSTANEGKAGYVIRVEVESEELGSGGVAKLGMTGQAEVVLERRSLLAILVQKLRRTISLG